MEKADLIKKWLDNNLNEEELKEFEALKDYDHLIKLSNNLKQFKAPEIDQNKILNEIILEKKQTKTPIIKLVKAFSKIAAILLICLGVYYFTSNNDTIITTVLADKTNISLPDNSTVHLNASSSVRFNKHNWSKKRSVRLDGEAFFKVAKGSKFDVITEAGIVSVLGTQFNIKKRGVNFEVTCYEGLVSVLFKDKTIQLTPGNSFKSGVLHKLTTANLVPFWMHDESHFKSEPFINVIQEFERQYKVTVQIENNHKNKLFTGRFVHNDIDIALKSITLPLHIKYVKEGDQIILKSETPK